LAGLFEGDFPPREFDVSIVEHLRSTERTDSTSLEWSRPPRLSSTFVRVAMPAYNEAEALPLLIPRIVEALGEANYRFDILVVNDCSTDRTAQVVEELADRYPLHLVSHERNQGLGGAITTCITRAIAGLHDSDVVITLDADNTHPPQLMTRMVPMIREGRDVVIASRYRDGSQVVGLERYRLWMSNVSSWMMRLLFGVREVRDYTCGYRAYRVGILRQAVEKYQPQLVRESGFAAMAELLLNVSRLEAIFGEAPLVLRYDQKRGASKMKVLRTIYRTLAMMARHRFSG
jgi:dolichol-phosphate mannosyltransferase